MNQIPAEAKRTAWGTAISASHYDRARPSYPAAAINWAGGGGTARRTVADIGAGTGILARDLAAHGHRVYAVDPSIAMLDAIGLVTGVITVVGTAEDTRLPNASCDVAVYAQCYQWLDPQATAAEADRILRPGGVVTVMWNVPDPTCPVLRVMSDIAGIPAERVAFDPNSIPKPWGPCVTHEVAQVQRVPGVTGALDVAASWAEYALADDVTARMQLLHSALSAPEMTRLLTADGMFELRYITEVHRATRQR